MVKLTDERDVETLRQISLLLDREHQRLVAKTLELTAELARLRGVPDVEQLTLTAEHELQQARTQIFQREAPATPAAPRRAQPGHGPRSQPALPIVEMRHELAVATKNAVVVAAVDVCVTAWSTLAGNHAGAAVAPPDHL